MEYQLNKITNEKLDIIALKNGKPKNSLSFEIPFSYAMKLVDINWNDILFAIQNGYFNNASAMEYAFILIGKDEENEKILDLAYINPSEITKEALLQEYVIELADTVLEEDKEETKDKIMYVLLNLLFDDKEKFVDPLFVVEYIYDDFDFPENIANFVRFMPIEIKKEKMYSNWQKYLSAQKLRFSPTQ